MYLLPAPPDVNLQNFEIMMKPKQTAKTPQNAILSIDNSDKKTFREFFCSKKTPHRFDF